MKTASFAAALALAFAATTLVVSDAAAGDVAAGKAVYDINCSSCHGPSGKGDGPVGAVLNPKPRDFSAGAFKFDADASGAPGEDADLKQVIQKGAGAFGGSPLMAGWPTLSDADIDNVIAFIRSLKQ